MYLPNWIFAISLVAISAGTVCSEPTVPAAIVCVKDASSLEKLAAKEIRRYVYLRTGELLPIVCDVSANAHGERIAVGTKDRAAVQALLTGANLKETVEALTTEQYAIKTTENNGQSVLLIVGGDAVGALYGAYRFAEHLGVRFYLDGDLIPDEHVPLTLPNHLDEIGKPLFAMRGILPFHDFPEGPDLWNLDDYRAVLAQLAKLRMNFIGLHTYSECGWGSEPTVWIGTPDDVAPDGSVRASYPAHYFNTARSASGHAAKKTGDFGFGAAQLFADDPFGPDVMQGLMPWGNTAEDRNELFRRTGALLCEAFRSAHTLGIKTCVGTEMPLLQYAPKELKQRLATQGKDLADPGVLQELYRGMFLRIMKTYPLDYYWLWTPESWRAAVADETVAATERDLLAAVAAAEDVGAPFALATAGWVLGPDKDRTLYDRILPKKMPFSCINLELGTVPVDPAFAQLKDRPKWAIPWLENDLSMSTPQMWVGRIRRDAADAYRYGCTGLMGIHWRTRGVGPMIGALAAAAWDQSGWSTIGADGQAADPILEQQRRNLPTGDFFLDWASHQFGPKAAKPIAEIFERIDGRLPTPAPQCPGGIVPDGRPWTEVEKSYAFVDDLARLQPQIVGIGNRDRFNYWFKSFCYLKATGIVACRIAELDRAMDQVSRESDPAKQKELARQVALPLRLQLLEDWGQMVTLLLETVGNWGEVGTVLTHEMFNMQELKHLHRHDMAIEQATGEPLPAEAHPWPDYRGPDRIILPTVRTSLWAGEDLQLRLLLLAKAAPQALQLHWRPLAVGEFQIVPFRHEGRGVYSALLPAQAINNADLEYYVTVESANGQTISYPVTAPTINQTVVVIP